MTTETKTDTTSDIQVPSTPVKLSLRVERLRRLAVKSGVQTGRREQCGCSWEGP